MDGTRAFAATVVAAAVLLAGGLVVGFYVGGTGVLGDPSRVDPAVSQFHAEAVCGSPAPVAVSGSAAAGSSFVRLNGTVSRPAGATVGNATLERVGLANYTLRFEPVAGDAPTCTDGEAVAAFSATVQVPHSRDEPYGITVRYEGETVAVVRNGPETRGPGLRGSTPENATTG